MKSLRALARRQGQGGLRAPPQVTAGSPIPVEVQAEGVTEVVVTGPDGSATTVPVQPDGTASVPTDHGWADGSSVTITSNQPPFDSVVVEISSEQN